MSRAVARFTEGISKELEQLAETGVFKSERVITTAQNTTIGVLSSSGRFVNFCANNYLGLSNNEKVKERSIEYTKKYGSGLSSVRFICGTQSIHKELEHRIARFHGREDAIVYVSCFDANAGIFEALFTQEDGIFSDELNHASIIDGVRLCKAQRLRYKHRDMQDLERLLSENMHLKHKIIVTDGVFSMDGTIAPLREIVELAKKYDSLTFIDECHATGFFGETGRGTEEYCGVKNEITLINSTLGKALGGAAGGYTTGPKVIIEKLRQKSRPYLFSNAMPPGMVGSAIEALNIIEEDASMLKKLSENTTRFRSRMKENGFTVIGDDHPICPVMMPDESTAVKFADKLLEKGIYVIGFTFPVVPKGKARIRCQISASHTTEQVDQCVDAFLEIKKELNI